MTAHSDRNANLLAAGKARQLGAQIRDVAQDLPFFLTSPLYRRWHLRWGATPQELTAPLPGDELLPRAAYRSTRAIDIAAPPEAVWPWLVQVGCRRAGWYSNDLLDNLGRPSAVTLLPVHQHLAVGQWVPMSPSRTPNGRTALKVHSFAVNRWLLWTKPDCTWVWQLRRTEDHGTRLVTRIHTSYDWRRPASALLGVVLMEFGDFAMLRRMLRGIKLRAQALAAADLGRAVSGAGRDPAPPDGTISRVWHRDVRLLRRAAGGT